MEPSEEKKKQYYYYGKQEVGATEVLEKVEAKPALTPAKPARIHKKVTRKKIPKKKTAKKKTKPKKKARRRR